MRLPRLKFLSGYFKKYREGTRLLYEGERWERLSRDISVIVSSRHRLMTDTVLLADFSLPRTGERCVEFGTGCGAIPLIWAGRSHPAEIMALEVQQEAADMAARSVKENRLESLITIFHMDLRSVREIVSLRNLGLVCCNPPYQQNGSGQQSEERQRQLARHDGSCPLDELAQAAARVLRFGGRFCLCHRPERLCAVITALQAANLEPKKLRFVQQREEKAPFLFLLQAVKGGKPGLKVEPVLFLQGENGRSEEIRRIYGDYGEQGK